LENAFQATDETQMKHGSLQQIVPANLILAVSRVIHPCSIRVPSVAGIRNVNDAQVLMRPPLKAPE
jgi:hypothetical protein